MPLSFKNTSLILFLLTTWLPVSLIAQGEKILVFSKTAGYRHESIPTGIAALKKLGAQNNFQVRSTENAAIFNRDSLQQYKAVVFLSTTGDILDSLQQQAFEGFIKSGGGFVGIHAASDTEYEWPWYGNLVGAYFKSHPAIQTATVKVADHVHPSTVGLPYIWNRTDEWYDYRENPRGKVHVLATLEEKSYTGGTMGIDHPTAWCHEYDGGKAWYTGGGHTVESYAEKNFLSHVLGGILYATGRIQGRFDATVKANYDVTVLDAAPVDPLALELLPDLSILYIERGGAVKIINQQTGAVEVAGKIRVSNTLEDGMLGVVQDPDFKNNQWIYIFYSPQEISEQHLSRFTLVNRKIDFASEKTILTIPTQRRECCHSGGALEFDSKGNLYISVGDNSNPFNSNGFAPLDETPGKEYWDAQRTAANSKDLRGKILRIKPTADGSYTIPAGNLFADISLGLPEIYIMGCRNPYRIAIDKGRDVLYWGEVGPDAEQNLTSRGPKGYDEVNRAAVAGNYGWPYCIGNNFSYVDFNFATAVSGNPFDCNHPENLSPNNTGIKNLPPAHPAWIWYPYDLSPQFPELGKGSRTVMAGGVYHYDSANTSEIKFPSYFNDKVIMYEWSRNQFFEITTTENGDLVKINQMLTNYLFSKPVDMTFGPDGAMYVAQWGTGFWGGNADARILKIGFIQGGRAPKAVLEASKVTGLTPLVVNFSAKKSSDPDPANKGLSFSWDVNGDGQPESLADSFSYTFKDKGVYEVILKVTDSDGKFTFAGKKITVGNTVPDVSITWPPDGGVFDWGDTVKFKVQVKDQEDGSTMSGSIPCNKVTAAASIGHNTHAHNTSEVKDCSGKFLTITHGDGTDNVFYVFNASYQDKGEELGIPLTGKAQAILRPKKLYAFYYDSIRNSVILKPETIPNEGPYIGNIADNGFIAFKPVNFFNIDFITFKAGATASNGFIELRLDSANGNVLAKTRISALTKVNNYYSVEIPEVTGSHSLYITFPGAVKNVTTLNWVEFFGKGVAKENLHPNTGLLATYTSDNSLEKRRKEPLIAFNWEYGNPTLISDSNNFTADWTGMLTPTETGTYIFQTLHSNGTLQMWVNDQLIINNSVTSSKSSEAISLVKDKKYTIRINYKHTTGEAKVYVQWKIPSLTYFNVIHTSYLTIPENTTGVDCNGDVEGTAVKDSCGVCSGGKTGLTPASTSNCINGVETMEDNNYFVLYPVLNKRIVFRSTITRGYFTVISAGGKVVQQGPFREGETEIHCNNCVEGLYLLIIASEEGKLIKKKLVIP